MGSVVIWATYSNEVEPSTMDDYYLSKEGFSELSSLSKEERQKIFDSYPHFKKRVIESGIKLSEKVIWESLSDEEKAKIMTDVLEKNKVDIPTPKSM